ncbi:MAG: hypothetical protein H6636_11775 [Anaerolineales bacterium]|nr:hypothetical protein [Anaerolineales bacterium]
MSTFYLHGLSLQPGDLICTADGDETPIAGHFWRFIGMFVPGEVDHIIIYLGPGGRCVEAGPRGVNIFDVRGPTWNALEMVPQRGPILDTFIGISSPVDTQSWNSAKKSQTREAIVAYCLAQVGKPYNANYFNPQTEEAFYCSQLAYLAYLPHGIDLNTELGVPDLPQTQRIIFPQEIWSGFPHQRPAPDVLQIPDRLVAHSMG